MQPSYPTIALIMAMEAEAAPLIEAMGLYHPVPTQISGGELDEADDLPDAPRQPQGGHR